jgi:inositol phosphorylceramide mannosyltransferase catalytic subunit
MVRGLVLRFTPITMPHAIPERIIQTAKTRALSLKQRAMTTNIKLLHPEYECVFFDNGDVDRFISQEFPQYKGVFDSFRFPIQRYDFFRYLAVYRLGGFYFDLDVLLASDLANLLPTGCVFPFEGLTFSRWLRERGMDWEIGNFAFGASPGHPFLEAVIENCVRGQRDPKFVEPMMAGVPALSKAEHYVLYSTGPGLLSRTLAEDAAVAKTVTVLFPEDVCDVGAWNVFGSFGVHLMEGSWRPSTSFVRRRIAQRWEGWARQAIVRKGRRLGKTRRVGTPGNVHG